MTIEKLDLAKNVHEQKKSEAQDLASALLDAEVRIGQLLKKLPKEPGKRTDLQPRFSAGTRLKPTKDETIKNLGFEKTQAHRFETLANHPEIVEQVKAEAIENDDLPTRTKVGWLIKYRASEIETWLQNPHWDKNISVPRVVRHIKI